MSTFDVFETASGGRIKAWVKGVPLEDSARKQLENVAGLPFVHSHLAVMPDVHFGRGATVGSVIPTKGAIIPAAVGVDIGCGMMAIETSLTANQLPDSLSALRSEIERKVPVGNGRGGEFGTIPDSSASAWRNSDLDDAAGAHPRQAPQGADAQGRRTARHAGRRQPLHRGLPR